MFSKDKMVIFYADGISGKDAEDIATNLQYAIQQSNVKTPVYISRHKWQNVSEDDLKGIRRELNEIAETLGWDK